MRLNIVVPLLLWLFLLWVIWSHIYQSHPQSKLVQHRALSKQVVLASLLHTRQNWLFVAQWLHQQCPSTWQVELPFHAFRTIGSTVCAPSSCSALTPHHSHRLPLHLTFTLVPLRRRRANVSAAGEGPERPTTSKFPNGTGKGRGRTSRSHQTFFLIIRMFA